MPKSKAEIAPNGDKKIDYEETIEEDVNDFEGEILVYMKDNEGV